MRSPARTLLPLLLLLPLLAGGAAPPAASAPGNDGFHDHRSGFAVQIGDETVELDTLAFSVLPGESVRLVVPLAAAKDDEFSWHADGAPPPERADSHSWRWRAPDKPGAYALSVVRTRTQDTMLLTFFVLTPASEIEQGALHGYRMGAYPATALGGKAIYLPPPGFIEVTAENRDLQVAPHFRLEQFLCKQAGGYPKYVAVDTRLLRKLEFLLAKLNDAGIRSDSLVVMSGFRTPEYNAALRDTMYSRHQWGDAADIYVDSDGNGRIDDLNRDGKANDDDSKFLYDFIEALSKDPAYAAFEGGLGSYGESASHPPFVHVDTRGFRARWHE